MTSYRLRSDEISSLEFRPVYTYTDFDSDTQSVHSNPNIDPQNTQIVPYPDSDAE